MEDLFEFLFNATGRINRAKYWRSLIVFGVAGLFAAVILFTAAGIAAPLFVATLVLVLVPWLIWGFVIHTERLHDRDKSAWWLLVFYGLPASARSGGKDGFISGRPCCNAVLHPGAGRICTLDLGIF
jgi:uncharacterized membrane protein YhaH (DUF805 family)